MPGFDDPPQQPSDGGWAMRNLESNLQACQTRLDNYDRLFAGYTELMLSAFDEGYQPTQYSMLMKRGGGWPGIVGGVSGTWPWEIYNTTTGSTGQVQVNGGDGQVAQLNGFVCNVNGNPSDTLISGAYPQLSITDNGVVYGYAVPTTPGTASPLTSLDLFYAGTLPSVDTNNPATYFPMLVATISNYATDGSGNVSFDVNNAYGSGYGPSQLGYCAADGSIVVG